MQHIAITGGIGSGKSVVCSLFEALGIPIFHADDEAKKLFLEPLFLRQLANAFGEEILHLGTVNRAVLADIVFQDPAKLSLLNQMIHPKVQEDFQKWISQQTAPYLILESALIFEIQWEHLFDHIICVSAPMETMVKRAMSRDQISRHSVEQRINNQISPSMKTQRADYVIYNDGEMPLLPQVLSLHALFTTTLS